MKQDRFLFSLLLLVVILPTGTPAGATSTYLAYNLDQPQGTNLSVTNSTWGAQGFTTTADAVVVTAVALPLRRADFTTGSFVLEIWDASGIAGAPGTRVAEILRSPVESLDAAFGLWLVQGFTIALNPVTDYYLIVRSVILTGPIFWGRATSSAGIGFPSDYSYTSNGGANWAAPTRDGPMRMSIRATAAVPEPAALALSGLGLAGLRLSRRR